MKFVGVSGPAWTIPGRWKEKKIEPVEYPELPPEPVKYTQRPIPRRYAPHKPKVVEEPPPYIPPPPKMESLKKPKKNATFSKEERFKLKEPPGAPGPGSYQQDLNKKVTASMPNFSFGYKFGFEGPEMKDKLDLPTKEPIEGLYYPLYLHKEPTKAISFSKQEKHGLNLLAGSCAPGPGFYKIPEEDNKRFHSYKSTWSKAKRGEGIYGQPSACEIPHPKDDYVVNQHTIAYKAKEKIRFVDDTPKPATKSAAETQLPFLDESPQEGLMTSVDYKSSGPKWTFGGKYKSSLDFSSNNANIGPGRYYKDNQFSKVKSLSKIPLSKRRPLNDNNDTPGPGTYPAIQKEPQEGEEEDNRKMKNSSTLGGPAFTIRGRHGGQASKHKYREPGPGQYEVGETAGFGRNVAGAGRFSMNERFPRIKSEHTLGPGSYYINRDLGTECGIKFPKARRKPMATDADADIEVGPGQYKLKSTVPQMQCFEQARMLQDGLINLD